MAVTKQRFPETIQLGDITKLEGTGARPSHHGKGYSDDGKSFTLNTVERHSVAYGIGRDAFNQGKNAKFGMSISENIQPSMVAKGAGAVLSQATIRRLTPLECERLQGLPDNFTLIEDKTCSDSARYKALGNGMAQPVATWIIRQIKENF